MVFAEKQSDNSNSLENLINELRSEVEQKHREFQEISMLVEQSQLEVNKLVQRNASATSKVQQIHGVFDSIPRDDIRVTYEDALDAQQRLFVMRGQLEKLQSDQDHLQRHLNQIENIIETFEGDSAFLPSGHHTSAFGSVEAIIQAQGVQHKLGAIDGHRQPILAPEHADQLEMTEQEVEKRWRRIKIKSEHPEL